MSKNSWYERQLEYVRKSLNSTIGQPRETSLPIWTYTEDFYKHWDNAKSLKTSKMREPKEILNSWDIRSTPRTEEAVREAQKEAWNEAIEAAAESAEVEDEGTIGRSGEYDEYYVVNKKSILKLKK